MICFKFFIPNFSFQILHSELFISTLDDAFHCWQDIERNGKQRCMCFSNRSCSIKDSCHNLSILSPDERPVARENRPFPISDENLLLLTEQRMLFSQPRFDRAPGGQSSQASELKIHTIVHATTGAVSCAFMYI